MRFSFGFLLILVVACTSCSIDQGNQAHITAITRQGLLVNIAIDKDDEHSCSSNLMFKDSQSEELFELKFVGEAPLLQAGLSVSLVGTVDDEREDVLIVMGDSLHIIDVQGLSDRTPANPGVINERLLVMLAESNSQKLDLPAGCDLAAIQSRFFGSGNSVATSYTELSNGQTLVSGEVGGPFNLGKLSGSCRRNAWIRKALRAYTGDASQFNRRVVIIAIATRARIASYF